MKNNFVAPIAICNKYCQILLNTQKRMHVWWFQVLLIDRPLWSISMIAFCFYVTGWDTRQRGKRGCTTEIAGVREGGRVGFVLDGEFTRSVSVLPITPIRHWQREHRLTLPRSTVQYVWDANPTSCSIARRRLTADARGRISRDLVIRGLYFTFTISASFFRYLSILSSLAEKTPCNLPSW